MDPFLRLPFFSASCSFLRPRHRHRQNEIPDSGRSRDRLRRHTHTHTHGPNEEQQPKKKRRVCASNASPSLHHRDLYLRAAVDPLKAHLFCRRSWVRRSAGSRHVRPPRIRQMSDVVSVLCLTAVNLSLRPAARGATCANPFFFFPQNLWTRRGRWSLCLGVRMQPKEDGRRAEGRPYLPARLGGIGTFGHFLVSGKPRAAICQSVGRNLERGRPSKPKDSARGLWRWLKVLWPSAWGPSMIGNKLSAGATHQVGRCTLSAWNGPGLQPKARGPVTAIVGAGQWRPVHQAISRQPRRTQKREESLPHSGNAQKTRAPTARWCCHSFWYLCAARLDRDAAPSDNFSNKKPSGRLPSHPSRNSHKYRTGQAKGLPPFW